MKSAIQIQSSEGQHHPEVEIVELLFMIMIQQWPIHEVVLPPGRIGIWTFGFLRGGETRRTRRKTIAARMRINKKLNPHVTPGRPGNRTQATVVVGQSFSYFLQLLLDMDLVFKRFQCKFVRLWSHCCSVELHSTRSSCDVAYCEKVDNCIILVKLYSLGFNNCKWPRYTENNDSPKLDP